MGDIAESGLRTSQLASGALPLKSSAIAALAEGDIVVALRGATNPAAIMPPLDEIDLPVFATLDVAVIRASKRLAPAYLVWFLNLPRTQEALSAYRSGSAAPRLPLPALKALDVPLPSLQRQTIIAAAAAEAKRESHLIDRLQQARQRLLNELLRQAAEEGSVPGGNPTRTDHYPRDRAATMRALSNPDDWK